MAVNDPCKEYLQWVNKWKKCRITVAGEEAVKEAGSIFLPPLSKQSPEEYRAYKMRALFYGATGRTVTGLLGAIFRKSPQYHTISERIKAELRQVTQDNTSADSFCQSIVFELLTVGRVGALIDAPPSGVGRAYVCAYQTEAIINWRYSFQEGRSVLSLVVLEESYSELDPKDPEGFSFSDQIQYRVLDLDEAGKYRQRIFQKDQTNNSFAERIDLRVTPTVSGRTLDYIPFIIFNCIESEMEIVDPPVLPLANVNLAHYRNSADLEHGRHYTGLPTAWIAGFDTGEIYQIGSSVAWVTNNTEARAGYLEFTGQGLATLENGLKEKQEQMAVLGARMLEDPKRAAESNEALSTRYRGENNILSSISKSASIALSRLFTGLMQWRGIQGDVVVELNQDFISNTLGSDTIKALMEAWQSQAISWDTLFYNFQKGEIYPEQVDKEMELMKIHSEVPIDTLSRKSGMES